MPSKKEVSAEKLAQLLADVPEELFAANASLTMIRDLVFTGQPKGLKELSASSTALDTVLKVFGLRQELDAVGTIREWSVRDTVKLSLWLSYGLHMHSKLMDKKSEATCRTVIDLLLLDALAAAALPNSGVTSFESWMSPNVTARPLLFSSSSAPQSGSASIASHSESPSLRALPEGSDGLPTQFSSAPKPSYRSSPLIQAFGEVYLTTIIGNHKCTGFANYCFGYERADQSLFAVVEAKKLSLNSTVAQTLFYMGMLRVARKRAGKPNTTIYGVATGPSVYVFIRIDNDGVVHTSCPLSLNYTSGRGKVLAFFRHIFSCLQRSLPTSSPTFEQEQRTNEAQGFAAEVEAKCFEIGGLALEEIDEDWMES